MTRWRLYARDAAGVRQGEISKWENAELVPRFNDVGTWVLNVPADSYPDLALPRWGVEFVRDGEVVLSGPITHRDRTFNHKENTLAIAGVDDNVILSWRVASPQPGTAAPPYNVTEYDTTTATASTVLRHFVDVNAGPSAVPARQWPGLTIAADPGVGSTILGRVRWQNLLAALQWFAAASSPQIGFRVRGLIFEAYAITDLSATVKFSVGLGNLAEFSYSHDAPDANYVYVAGGGEGTARTIVERSDASIAEWGRIEQFVDRRDTSDTTELAQSGDKTLADQAARSSVSITPIEGRGHAYLTDYNVGDKVTVTIDDTPIVDVVREVKITLDRSGETIVPGIGSSSDQFASLRMFARLAALEGRVENLEVR